MGPAIYFEASLDWLTVEGKLNNDFNDSRSKGESVAHTARCGENVYSAESSRSRGCYLTASGEKKGERERRVSKCNA